MKKLLFLTLVCSQVVSLVEAKQTTENTNTVPVTVKDLSDAAYYAAVTPKNKQRIDDVLQLAKNAQRGELKAKNKNGRTALEVYQKHGGKNKDIITALTPR